MLVLGIQGCPSARLASSAAPATLEILLPHLFASGFSHLLVNPFLKQRFPMTLPGSLDWSAATARGRGCCPFHRRIPHGVFAIQVGQQVGGAIPNAADLFGQHCAVKPALGFGLDSSDQHPELLRATSFSAMRSLVDSVFCVDLSIVMTRR